MSIEDQKSLRIAVDIGGTFTDMACFDETSGEIKFGKALSTHGHLHEGIMVTYFCMDQQLQLIPCWSEMAR